MSRSINLKSKSVLIRPCILDEDIWLPYLCWLYFEMNFGKFRFVVLYKNIDDCECNMFKTVYLSDSHPVRNVHQDLMNFCKFELESRKIIITELISLKTSS